FVLPNIIALYIFISCNSIMSLFNCILHFFLFIFFFNDTATTEIYTLSLHDALPISYEDRVFYVGSVISILTLAACCGWSGRGILDRKSTRLNSSHVSISYAVFCLKKKKKILNTMIKYDDKCIEK